METMGQVGMSCKPNAAREKPAIKVLMTLGENTCVSCDAGHLGAQRVTYEPKERVGQLVSRVLPLSIV